jgi:cytochrome P450
MAMPERSGPRNAVEAVVSADPYAYYAALRERSPLFYDEGLGLWVAAAASVVEEALRHPALRVRPPGEPVPRTLIGTPMGEVFAQLVRMTDGEFHATHKPHVERAARRYSMEDVASAAAKATTSLMQNLDGNALLAAVPVRSIAILLGIGEAALGSTTQWVADFVQALGANPSAEIIARGNEAALALMAQGKAAGLEAVAAANRIALMQQSLDATAGLIGNTVLSVREQATPVRGAADLAAWRALVVGVTRSNPPVHNTRRFAAEDLTLAGRRIAQGQGLLLVLASAGMTFGGGVHGCPGEAIAIEIAAGALQTLSAQGPLERFFGRFAGWRALPNARVPVFET